MFRPLTFITIAMACGSGLYLYQVKHQAQVLDRQIERTVKQTEALRAQARELDAAWTLLGNPSRIQQLASQFLNVQPVQPNQFVALSDLDSRLPAPRPLDATPATPPVDETPVAVAAPATPGAPTTPGAPPSPGAAPTRVVVATAAAPVVTPPADLSAAAAPAPSAEPPRPVTVAARPVDRKPVQPIPTPRPAHPRDVAQTPLPRTAPTRPAIQPVLAEYDRSAAALRRQPPPAQPVSGSLLGMAHEGAVSVAAPQPIPLAPTRWGN
jgi:hypothetical protein